VEKVIVWNSKTRPLIREVKKLNIYLFFRSWPKKLFAVTCSQSTQMIAAVVAPPPPLFVAWTVGLTLREDLQLDRAFIGCICFFICFNDYFLQFLRNLPIYATCGSITSTPYPCATCGSPNNLPSFVDLIIWLRFSAMRWLNFCASFVFSLGKSS